MSLENLAQISNALEGIVDRAGGSVVRVEARRRVPSSGVAWSEDVVAAANHAVEWDDEITVGLPDGETAVADVTGRDSATDLAILKLRAGRLRPAAWSDVEGTKPGALAVAVSRPGRAVRAHLGAIAVRSGEWRSPAGGRLDAYLETTIPIRWGFSGSLLVAATGDAIGVNTSGLRRGTSLAVPGATVRRVVEGLLAHGRIRRGYLGIGTYPVRFPSDLAEKTGQRSGLLVVSIAPGGPAAKAGLVFGDVLVAFDGRPVSHAGELIQALDEESVGKSATLRIVRAGELRDIAVEIGARDAA